jgi:hypothetical protein
VHVHVYVTRGGLAESVGEHLFPTVSCNGARAVAATNTVLVDKSYRACITTTYVSSVVGSKSVTLPTTYDLDRFDYCRQ